MNAFFIRRGNFLQFKALLLCFLLIKNVYALVPLESLMLGDFSSQYNEKSTDPIEYIFDGLNPDQNLSNYYRKQDFLKHRAEIGRFRGFFEEGENLQNICKQKPNIQYATHWDKQQVKRSFLSTLQYIGLDLTTRALPLYAKFFEFSEDEYKNLGNNLIGNYCSQNLSIISLRQLRKNWMTKFSAKTDLSLPSIDSNPLFPEKLSRLLDQDEVMKRGFYNTIELFKSVCSWGGDVDNLRLLIPLVRDPIVMAFVIRQITSQKIEWEPVENKIYRVDSPASVQILCDNLVCRKVEKKVFQNKIPRSVGSDGLEGDYSRLYCQEFRDSDYLIKDQVEQLTPMIKKMTFDDQLFLSGHMISLLTGIPDFLNLLDKYESGKEMTRLSMDRSWDNWAKSQNDRFDRSIFYEESLTIELVNRKHYFNRFSPKFSVEFDVNLGEFDRANQKVGKVSSVFHLKVSKKFLAWARKIWKNIDTTNDDVTKKVLEPFKVIIQETIDEAQKSYDIAPWKDSLERLIMTEILNQVALYEGDFFNNEKGIESIPVSINYGIFAMKYIRFQHSVEQNEGKREERIQRLRALKY